MQVFRSALVVAVTWFVACSALASDSGPVVFVCAHGSVKSMIAAEWFNRLAADRGRSLTALSRGVEPDEVIPEGILAKLRGDGFELDEVLPIRIQYDELAHAAHVVVIGAQSPLFDRLESSPERWDDIPPASTDYEASRNAMLQQIEKLLDDLAARP